ncbi:MAG: [Fe-Fe] hydrogenase large subunit C-terminal domain-containing protein [Erysipelotrichaceae bacterium]
MNRNYIQLQDSNCRNCMRCVRVCPTKAMTYINHQPIIAKDECILCGQCYVVCPHQAKKIHSDLAKIKKWLKDGEKLIMSIAPSFASIWPNYPLLNKQLLALGFYKTDETSKGAKIVSESYGQLLKEKKMKNIITTCCPAVVALVEKDYPELVDQLAPVVSPMVAHGRTLKKENPGCKVVFLSPCIAKQKETHDERFEDAIDATISMGELYDWLKSEENNDEHENWSHFDGDISRIYPTPGGVIRTLSKEESPYEMVSVEGVERIKRTFDAIISGHLEGYFFDMSACEESCLGGPLLSKFKHNQWIAQKIIRENVTVEKIKPKPIDDLYQTAWKDEKIEREHFDESRIQDMLYVLGKTNKTKELDCGSCGYETCREKAIAVLQGKADPNLCLPQALENAQSLSNLVIKNTPNGIIVVNKQLEIQELNPAASHMLTLDQIQPIGLPILSILPNLKLQEILENPQPIQYLKARYPQYNLYVDHAITYLEENEVFIIILMDLTVEEAREKIIKQMQTNTIEVAQRVIDEQMRTAQEVASLLGESTAKSKVALSKLMKVMQDEHE